MNRLGKVLFGLCEFIRLVTHPLNFVARVRHSRLGLA